VGSWHIDVRQTLEGKRRSRRLLIDVKGSLGGSPGGTVLLQFIFLSSGLNRTRVLVPGGGQKVAQFKVGSDLKQASVSLPSNGGQEISDRGVLDLGSGAFEGRGRRVASRWR
jgi:hypothetical protein